MKNSFFQRASIRLLAFFMVLVFAGSTLSACSTVNSFLFKPEVQIKEVWQRKTGAGSRNFYTRLVPAVTEDRIFVADITGQVMAYERNKGKLLWQKSFPDAISGGVFVGYGVVLFGTQEGNIFALDASNGQTLWEKSLSSEILSVPQANGQLVIVQTLDGKLFALDQKTGAQKWLFQVTVPSLSLRGTSSPKLLDEIVLAGFANGKLIAVLLQTGLPVWERAVAQPQGRSELDRIVDIDGDFIVDGQTVYAATFQGNIAAIDLRSGRPLWQREMSSGLSLAEGLGNIYAIDSNSRIVALDQPSGADVWEQKALQNKKLSAPVKFGNYIVTGDDEGFLHFISQIDGSIVEKIRIKGSADNLNPQAKPKARFTPTRIEPGNGLRTEPVVKDGLLYVINNSGTLRALSVVN